MTIIIGFGKTETDLHEKINNKVEDIFKKIYLENIEDNEYGIGQKTIELFRSEINKISEISYEKYKEIEKMDVRPGRYTRIIKFRVGYDYDTIFIKTYYCHVNTKSPLSNDGVVARYPEIYHGFSLQDLGLSDD